VVEEEDSWLTPEQIGHLLGLSHLVVKRLIENCELQSERYAGEYRSKREWVQAYIRRNTTKGY